MKHLKALIAGMFFPSLILPIVLIITVSYGNRGPLNSLFIHLIPLIWGIWNILYFAVCKHFLPGGKSARLFVTGGSLGLLLALFCIYCLELPRTVGLPQSLYYAPLIIAPVAYALVWRYVVSPLNCLLRVEKCEEKVS